MKSRAAVVVWAALLIASVWIIFRIPVKSDLTAFLPAAATPAQELLLAQLQEGAGGRVVLIGIEGAQPEVLAHTSRELSLRLNASGLFGHVNNGESLEAAREFVMRHRYLLSPTVSKERFTESALKSALEEGLQLLASPAGTLVKDALPADPTLEHLQILAALNPRQGPASEFGVWFSRDGKQALMLAETRAAGSDLDSQQKAIETISSNFAEIGGQTKLLLTGPAVFATESRATIEGEAWRLSMAATLLVVVILFCVYRSAFPVLLTALPVVSGLIIGIAAVALGFGVVHGLTLAFGATLIGEAVDYPSYVFTHARRGEPLARTLTRIWPTLRLAVLTTVFGALAMLLSSFTGLSQLGLLTVSGVVIAGLTTRFVLPAIAPRVSVSARIISARAFAVLAVLKCGAFLLWVLVLASFAVLAFNHERIWDDDIANLSPISPAAKRLDQELRSELGAPDARYLLVIAGASKHEALRLSEQKASWIDGLVASGVISGYELAATILPSVETQEARRAALPDSEELKRNLTAAAQGLPFREGVFAPFIADVARAKKGALIDEAILRDSPLALKVDSLLFAASGRWFALAPLTGVADAQALARAAEQQNDIRLLDLKSEAIELIASYRSESLGATALGMVAIVAVLAFGLGSMRRAARVLTPVFAAVVIDLGALVVLGERLTLFHLVSLLLVVGIGLNYSLFFNRPPRDGEDRRRTLTSLLVCSSTTISAFGCLAFSTTPVLHAIGVTVALGALLSLLSAAVLQDSGSRIEE